MPVSATVPHVLAPERVRADMDWRSRRAVLGDHWRSSHACRVGGDRREALALVYNPERERNGAPFIVSPDGAWVLIVEMVRPVWQPCRLVAMDGGHESSGRS